MNERQVANTREKLRRLQEAYEEVRDDAEEDAHVRELTMESLMRTINQFKEEIARYEAHHPVRG